MISIIEEFPLILLNWLLKKLQWLLLDGNVILSTSAFNIVIYLNQEKWPKQAISRHNSQISNNCNYFRWSRFWKWKMKLLKLSLDCKILLKRLEKNSFVQLTIWVNISKQLDERQNQSKLVRENKNEENNGEIKISMVMIEEEDYPTYTTSFLLEEESSLPSTLKLELPLFDRSNPQGWLFKTKRFFICYKTPEDRKLLLASFQMVGKSINMVPLDGSKWSAYYFEEFYKIIIKEFFSNREGYIKHFLSLLNIKISSKSNTQR